MGSNLNSTKGYMSYHSATDEKSENNQITDSKWQPIINLGWVGNLMDQEPKLVVD
jgi:hypothetical protein